MESNGTKKTKDFKTRNEQQQNDITQNGFQQAFLQDCSLKALFQNYISHPKIPSNR